MALIAAFLILFKVKLLSILYFMIELILNKREPLKCLNVTFDTLLLLNVYIGHARKTSYL